MATQHTLRPIDSNLQSHLLAHELHAPLLLRALDLHEAVVLIDSVDFTADKGAPHTSISELGDAHRRQREAATARSVPTQESLHRVSRCPVTVLGPRHVQHTQRASTRASTHALQIVLMFRQMPVPADGLEEGRSTDEIKPGSVQVRSQLRTSAFRGGHRGGHSKAHSSHSTRVIVPSLQGCCTRLLESRQKRGHHCGNPGTVRRRPEFTAAYEVVQRRGLLKRHDHIVKDGVIPTNNVSGFHAQPVGLAWDAVHLAEKLLRSLSAVVLLLGRPEHSINIAPQLLVHPSVLPVAQQLSQLFHRHSPRSPIVLAFR
mmetsp:Transcript_39094/g.85287  ORF Transcript_39094/g.85287 Transcript_39094/m.85287 type:complete len:315 (+) Transcript_39094:344-1288(+)